MGGRLRQKIRDVSCAECVGGGGYDFVCFREGEGPRGGNYMLVGTRGCEFVCV